MTRTWFGLLASRPFASGRRNPRRRFQLEHLEERRLMSGNRTFDGVGNNLLHPSWGSAGTPLLRVAPAAYADGVSTPAGSDLPGARELSNVLGAESAEVLNDRFLSDFIYVFGQMVDHDLDLTVNATPSEPFNIPVPAGDPIFDPAGSGNQVLLMNRSKSDPTTGTGIGNPRQQINEVTSWLDGSQIYGSSEQRARALRTLEGGRLKTSAGNLLPFNTMGLSNQAPFGADPTQFFVAGDVRVNENIELTAIQTLWMREHNRLADVIQRDDAGLTDEEIYQRARRLVIAEFQQVVYNEFLPALLGPGALRAYTGYRPTVNAGIANEFSTMAFRVGHTFLGDDVEFLDNDGREIREEVALRDAFFQPGLVREYGIEPILKYVSADKAREGDTVFVDGVRNFLFDPPGPGVNGFDLFALDVQRARDHGLPDYNTMRAAYGLPPVRSFAQITSDRELQAQLRSLYGDVGNVDAFVGGLAEDRAPGASVGPLFRRAIAEQFERLRDGDRFWYERELSPSELNQVRGTTLSNLIRRNTTITNIQDNAFFFEVTVRGRVFLDFDRDAKSDRFEPGLPLLTVQLLDADNKVVASTRTRLGGSYAFVGLMDSPGYYRIQLVVPHFLRATSPNPVEIEVTRGGIFRGVNFGVVPGRRAGDGAGRHHSTVMADALADFRVDEALLQLWPALDDVESPARHRRKR